MANRSRDLKQDDSKSEETIFSTALHCAPAERAAYLDHACAGQPALRERIAEFLKAQPEVGGFMERPLTSEAADALETGRLGSVADEEPGTRIDPYKLLHKLGEGGCGVVYMAEQEAPIRRRVAHKVIKLDMADLEQFSGR